MPDDMLNTAMHSPLRHTLLREASEPEQPLSRPPLPLRAGHVALLLAGGLCDELIDDPVQGRFLVKGMLLTGSKKIHAETKEVGEVETYRTDYSILVRALRESGEIESYTSQE